MTERKQRIEIKQIPIVANNTGYINKQVDMRKEDDEKCQK